MNLLQRRDEFRRLLKERRRGVGLSESIMTNRKSENSRKLEEDSFMSGVAVLEAGSESAAEKAGLRKGDVIIEYAGVADLTIDTLPDLTTKSNRSDKTVRLAFIRDGSEHSVEVLPGSLGISATNTTVHGIAEPRLQRNKIAKKVRIMKTIYLVLTVLASVAAILSILLSENVLSWLQDVALGIIYGTVYLGLRYRKKWVIALILIFSALNCLTIILLIIQPAENVEYLWVKIVRLFMLFFFAYNIMFFQRSNVRSFFGDKGTVVF